MIKYLLLLLLSAPVAAEYYIMPGGAANHNNIIASAHWTQDIPYGVGSYVNCNGSNSGSHSMCYFNLDVYKILPPTATGVKLRIKHKAWTFGQGQYCLIHIALQGNNHLLHTENWGYGSEQRRRVSYTVLDAEIVGNTVSLEVGKEIVGGCTIETAVYIEGYYE